MDDIKKQVKVGFGVMLLRDGKILLGKRHDEAEKASSELHGEGTWTMPGGKMHFGEKFEEACRRETLEETGIKIDPSKLKLISLTNNLVPDAHFVTLGFLSQDFHGTARVMEPDEITEWRWYEIDQVPDNMYPPSREVLDNYLAKNIYNQG